MPNAKRGEVWQVDFGLAAKVRLALVLGCDIADEDRVLVAVVYHTRSLRGSRYEVRRLLAKVFPSESCAAGSPASAFLLVSATSV